MKRIEAKAFMNGRTVKGLLVFTGIVLLYWMGVWFLGAQSTCVFKNTIGLPCPGCGLTRSWIHVFHFEFAEAFWDHPLWPLTMLLVISGGIEFVRVVLFNKGPSWMTTLYRSNGFWLVLLVVIVGVYLIRLFYLFPDTAPMDYNASSILEFVIKSIKKLLISS